MVKKKININSQIIDLEFSTEKTSLYEISKIMNYPTAGVAIAVNQEIIPRERWDKFEVSENDRIVVIKAACGG